MNRSISRSTPYLPRYQSVSPARSPHMGSRRFSSPRSASQPRERILYIDNAPSRVINSYHVHHSPSPSRTYRIHLFTNKKQLTRVTRSRSACDINSSHVYTSQEDIFVRSLKESASRQVGSSEDVYHAVPFFPDVTPSESGVSFGDWEEGSTFGGEDDNVSQHSFGSSSAFCEVTVDSELDKCDSDNFSGPDYIGDRALGVLHENVSDTNYEIKRRRSRRSHDGLESPDYKIVESVSDTKSRRREPVSSQSLDFNKLQTQPEALCVIIPESEISGKVNGDKVGSRGTPLAHSTPHVSPGGPGESKLCVMASWDVDAMGDAINGTESETSTPARTSSVQGNDSRYSSRFEDSSCNSSCSEDNYSDISNLTASSPVTRRTKLVKRHSDKPVASKKSVEILALNEPDIVLARTVEGGSDKRDNSASEEVKQQRSGKSSYTFNGTGVLEAQQKLTTDASEKGEPTDKHTAGNEWWASYGINETAGHKYKSSEEGDTEKSLLFRRIPTEAKPPAVNIPLITAGKHGQEKLRKLSQMSPPLGSPTNGSPPVFPNDLPNFGENKKDAAEHLTAHHADVGNLVAALVQSDSIQNQKHSEVEWEDGNKPSVSTDVHHGLSNTSRETTENNSRLSQVENPTSGEVLQLELPTVSLPSTEERVHEWQKYVNENSRALSHATEHEGANSVKEAVEIIKTEPDNSPSHTAIMSREPDNNIANIDCIDGGSTVYGVATDEALDATCVLTPAVYEDSHQQIPAQSRVEDYAESTRVTVDTPQLHVVTDVDDSVDGIGQFGHSTNLDICTPGSKDEFISKQTTSDDHQNVIYWEENEVGQNRATILDRAVNNTLTPNSEATEMCDGKISSGYVVSSDNVDAVIFAKNSYVLSAGDSDSCCDIKDVVLSDIVPETAVAAENIVTQDLHQFSASAPYTSSVEASIIIETGSFQQSQPQSIDTEHMGNTIDNRDTPQVVQRDVSSHLFVGIVQHRNPDLDLSLDTTSLSGNTLSASCSEEIAHEVITDTGYKSPADSYILSSLDKQQLVNSLEDRASEIPNTDNSPTVNESGHIEGKDWKAPETSFVETSDTENDVQGENGFDKHTEETVNFVERQECVYCPSYHEKAVIIVDKSSRLIESSTCITSPTVVAESKVHSSVSENSSCSDSVGVESVADLHSIESFTTTDKEIVLTADKEVFCTTDSEAFTTADKEVFSTTDSEAFTTADKEVLPTSDSEAFTTADKEVFSTTNSEAFTTADQEVFSTTDSEAFTTADQEVFPTTDREAYSTTDKKAFLTQDKEAFLTQDKREAFSSTDKEAFPSTEKEAYPSPIKEAFPSTDKEAVLLTHTEAFSSTDKEDFPSTDKEDFPSIEKEAYPSPIKEAFPSTDKEAFPSADKEAFHSTDKEVFLSTDKEAFSSTVKKDFPSTDKEANLTTDNEPFPTVDKEVLSTIAVTADKSYPCINKEITISTEPISVATCVTVSSPATSRNIAPEIIYGLNLPEQISNSTSLLSTSFLEAETPLTIPSSSLHSSVLTAETSVQSDHFLAPECVQENVANAESGLDFAYDISSPVTSVSELEVGGSFDSIAHTQEATMHPNNPLEKLQAHLSLLSGDTELIVTRDRNQHQDRTEAPDAFHNSVDVDTCDFIDFSKDPCKSIDEESVMAHANGVVVLRDELNNSTQVDSNSNAGSHVVARYNDSDYDNVTTSVPSEQQLYTRPRHLHLLQYAHTKVSDLWALQEETESAMNTPSPKQPRVTFTNDADSSNLHSTYSAQIFHGNSIEQNVQDDQIKKLLNGHTRLVSNPSIVEMNDKSRSVLTTAESSISEVKIKSDITPILSEVKSVATSFDGDILGNHIADDETGESENSSASAINRQTTETVSGVFRAHLVNISHTGVENSDVDVSVDEDKNRISHLGTLTSNLGYSSKSQTGEDLIDNVSSLDALSASLKQFNITSVSSSASDSGYYDDSSMRTYQIEMNSDEDANKTSYLPSYSLDVSASSTNITETPQKTNNGSVYTCTGTAEIKATPINDSQIHTPETDHIPLSKKTVANNKLTNAKIKQFEKILYEFNKGLRTSQDISDFLFFCENYADYRNSSASSSEELYKYFTNDDSEKVQNHTCITVEDENMNTYRFKRYLKKSHAKRNNGRKILKFLSKLSCVSETMSSPIDKPSEKVKIADRFAQIFSTDSMPSPKMRISNPVLISSTSFQLHDILNSSSKRYDNNGNTSFDSFRTSADSAYSSLSEPTLGSLSSPAFRHTPGSLESVSSVFNLDIASGEWTFADNVFSNTSNAATRNTFAKNATNQSVGHDRDTVFSSSDEIHHFNFSENEIDSALLNRMRYGHVPAELN
ncbi:hypothetical protein BsWGS_11538 [Bradybaena similaris]